MGSNLNLCSFLELFRLSVCQEDCGVRTNQNAKPETNSARDCMIFPSKIVDALVQRTCGHGMDVSCRKTGDVENVRIQSLAHDKMRF
jgi:hypothetical protein